MCNVRNGKRKYKALTTYMAELQRIVNKAGGPHAALGRTSKVRLVSNEYSDNKLPEYDARQFIKKYGKPKVGRTTLSPKQIEDVIEWSARGYPYWADPKDPMIVTK